MGKDIILVLANNSDGLYGFRKELLEALSRRAELYAAIPDNGCFAELESIGCQVIEIPVDRRGVNPITDIRLFFKYLRLIQELTPTKVITYTVKPNIYGGIACQLCKVPYAVNITGLGTTFQKKGLLRSFVSLLYKVASFEADAIFFENSGSMQVMVDEKIVNWKQCCVLNGAGVNLDKYRYMDYPKEDRKIRFLFVGRIMKEKGVDELFEAITRLKSEYGENVILDVVGMFEESYQQRIEKLQNDDIIVFHGYQQDVKPFYETAHCVVLPSYHEGMSNVLLEAASCGRPIITSNICGCREAVDDGVSGFLCEAKNTESLYNAMKHFVELTREERIKFGLAGRERMEKIFDKREVVKKTIERLYG